jgi:hypothetical protein
MVEWYTKNMQHTMYHSVLRIAGLTLAVILLFDSGLLSPVTSKISQDTQLYLASAIGMQARVVPTELNQITAGLTQRDMELTQRENDIAAREIAVNLEAGGAPSRDFSSYIMSVLLFVILVLIVLNYALDFIRYRERITIQSNEKMA